MSPGPVPQAARPAVPQKGHASSCQEEHLQGLWGYLQEVPGTGLVSCLQIPSPRGCVSGGRFEKDTWSQLQEEQNFQEEQKRTNLMNTIMNMNKDDFRCKHSDLATEKDKRKYRVLLGTG